MNATALLELHLSGLSASSYNQAFAPDRPDLTTTVIPTLVRLRFTLDDEKMDYISNLFQASFDLTELAYLAHQETAGEYSQALYHQMFMDDSIRNIFSKHLYGSIERNISLLIRILIDVEVAILHTLRWEMLRDPRNEFFLSLYPGIHVTRYLNSLDALPIKPRRHHDPRALMVVANPSDLSQYGLADLSVLTTTHRPWLAQHALAPFTPTEISAVGNATLSNIFEHLRSGTYDILYLICHGAFLDGVPKLFLEHPDGAADVVVVERFLEQMRTLDVQPRLVVLASCESVGGEHTSNDNRASISLAFGPQVAMAGVPAVVAIRGTMLVAALEPFMAHLFAQLSKTGSIDMAMTAARRALHDLEDLPGQRVRRQDEFWRPVLFTRLKSDRLWYTPGFLDEEFEKWRSIRQKVVNKEALVIIGQDINTSIIKSAKDIAKSWADFHRFPLEPHSIDALPRVAQYLDVNQTRHFPHEQLAQDMFLDVIGHLISLLQTGDQQKYNHFQEAHKRQDSLPLDELQVLVDTVVHALSSNRDVLADQRGQILQDNPSLLPHIRLAEMPFKLYISATPDPLLEIALRLTGRNPRIVIHHWREKGEGRTESPYATSEPQPSLDVPIIFYLFGHIREPQSLVLTEHDYFDYLINVLRYDSLPTYVTRSLTGNTLLFSGFSVHDHEFRAIYAILQNLGGYPRLSNYIHAAVQVSPEEDRFLNAEKVRDYIREYCSAFGIKIYPYWGTCSDFIEQLYGYWKHGMQWGQGR